MPTAGGLPKPGETWRRTYKLPPDWEPHTITFRVIQRGSGSYWSLRVEPLDPPPKFEHEKRTLWVDASYWFSRGELEFVK